MATLEDKIFTDKSAFHKEMIEFTQKSEYTITPTLRRMGGVVHKKYFVEHKDTVYRVILDESGKNV